MSWLLDTCFVSEFTRARWNPGVHEWLAGQDEGELYLCSVTVGELEKGLAALPESRRKRRLREFIEVEMVERFAERILPTDQRAWRRWGELMGAAERKGRPLPAVDALITAVAQVNGCTIVTRNAADFLRCGAEVHNPWTEEGPRSQ